MKRLVLSLLLAVAFIHTASIAFFCVDVLRHGVGTGPPPRLDAGQLFAMLVLPLWFFQDKIWLAYLTMTVVVWLVWTMFDRAIVRRRSE